MVNSMKILLNSHSFSSSFKFLIELSAKYKGKRIFSNVAVFLLSTFQDFIFNRNLVSYYLTSPSLLHYYSIRIWPFRGTINGFFILFVAFVAFLVARGRPIFRECISASFERNFSCIHSSNMRRENEEKMAGKPRHFRLVNDMKCVTTFTSPHPKHVRRSTCFVCSRWGKIFLT